MKLWLRRLFYLFLLLLWLAFMVFPFLALTLSSREELRLGGEERAVRIFLVRGGNDEGVGVAWQRPLANQPTCHKTSVTYFMWRGAGQNTVYCTCRDSGPIACPP